jgi:fatty acid desaturase
MVSVEPVAADRLRPLLALVEMRTQAVVAAAVGVTIMILALRPWVVPVCWVVAAVAVAVLLTQETTSKQEESEVRRIAPTLAVAV